MGIYLSRKTQGISMGFQCDLTSNDWGFKHKEREYNWSIAAGGLWKGYERVIILACFVGNTIYYIPYTIYYILYTIYYILYTIYYILYNYYILYTIYYIHYTNTTQKATPYDFHDFTRCFFPEVHAEVHSTPVYLWISHDERPSRRVSTVRRCSQWDLCQHIYGISIV